MVLELVSGERALYVSSCNRSWRSVRLGRAQRDAGVCECGGAPRRAAELDGAPRGLEVLFDQPLLRPGRRDAPGPVRVQVKGDVDAPGGARVGPRAPDRLVRQTVDDGEADREAPFPVPVAAGLLV